MNMDNFIDIDDKIKFDTDEFIQLVRRRRSHRSFKNKDVPLQDLESLVDLCRYAPTGSNRQTVEIIMIQDNKKIKRLSDLTVDFFKDMIDQVERQVEELKGAGKEIPEDLQYTYSNLVSRKRLVVARDSGMDPIFHKAPAVMIFHSPTLTSTPKDDCVIAAQTVVLTAMTMGLETCYIGLFEAAARDYPPIGEELMLPPGNQVLSVLIMGYPRLTYLRTVDRKPIKVRWE
jgi:nitroreductase